MGREDQYCTVMVFGYIIVLVTATVHHHYYRHHMTYDGVKDGVDGLLNN